MPADADVDACKTTLETVVTMRDSIQHEPPTIQLGTLLGATLHGLCKLT